jgi:hypothetical protein
VFGDDMHNKTKSIAIVTITVVIIASFVFLSLPNALAEEDTITTDIRQRMGSFTKKRLAIAIGRRFLKNGVPETLVGEVYVVERFILVIDIEGDKVNVIMPKWWTINGETKNTKDLFDGDPFNIGDEVIIETLKLEIVKETHTVNSYFAYSINSDGTTANALLPVNVEVG